MSTNQGQAGAAVDAVIDRATVDAVLDDPAQPRLVFQPIVDLRRGVVAGYEALARFAGPPLAAPDVWFAAADRYGVGARLEARVVRAAIRARATLPDECFLTVNLSPHLMCEPELRQALTEEPDLSRLVLELTEHVQVADHEPLTALLDQLRSAGATVALDDAGSGYSGLQQLALFRPEMVKIDRALVDHADRDEVKLALAELLGTFAGRLDAVLIAEGVERPEELEAFSRLGVPLGQGWLFGRPGPGFATLAPELGDRIRALARRSSQVDSLGGLLEETPVVQEANLGRVASAFQDDPGLDVVAVLDQHGTAVCLLRRRSRAGDEASTPQVLPVSLRAAATADIAEAAGRAMVRPPSTRFDPIVCADPFGTYLGIVRPERLMLRLAELKVARDRADTPSTGLRLITSAGTAHQGAHP